MDYMKLALDEAKKAYLKGEVPIGAIIVKDGEVIAKSHNMKETLKSAIAHAEILAIEEASRVLGDWRLSGAEMYVTLEPCSMCASAIAQSRISKLYIGTFNRDMGSCGTILNIFDYDIFNTYVEVKWCYNSECSDLMSNFFENRRRKVISKGER
ncbi:nucleoside deaminase [Clostridium celatum]|uniref:tRNA-specific adenosine deaminase n=1 Tax=Clostridium celatum DSM 1785 TaxID=545697 RepID=L1QAT3_9CLOT|nr:nucleoside deaminase [Clostridium celatum]EKY25051.1 cytidine and deoxycytidylate deaminase zinc-binding region [Clostridium celatum DSM 1785]MCE9656205.1 nucleoside deaminase [Clostridium celatum]MDU2265848.1 nucleoside deaminase [Clostridium celatum]MDU6297102.1 nucleoside deaminase [Clostridium celatum]MDY3359733.1 nucleoside deaminase [Clostridium celatum]